MIRSGSIIDDRTKVFSYITLVTQGMKQNIERYTSKFLLKIFKDNFISCGGLPDAFRYKGQYFRKASYNPTFEDFKVIRDLSDENAEIYESILLNKIKYGEDAEELYSLLRTIALDTEGLNEFIRNIPEKLDSWCPTNIYRVECFSPQERFKCEIKRISEIYSYWEVLNRLLELDDD